MQVIDFHTHIYPEKVAARAVEYIGNFYELNMECDGRSNTLAALHHAGTIDRFCVLPVAMNPAAAVSINHFIEAECAANACLIGFSTLHPDMEQMEAELNRIIAAGSRGVKFHPDMQRLFIDEAKMYPIYEAVQGRLPIIFHTGDHRYPYSHPARLVKIMRDFPKLTVIASHFGGYSVYDEAQILLKNERCYMDTSSSLAFLSKEHACHLIDTYGAERMLFGSDFPMWNPGGELERFWRLGLNDADTDAILSGNARRLLGLT